MEKSKIIKTTIIAISSLLLIGAGVGTFMYFKRKKESELESEEYGASEKEVDKIGGELGQPDETEYSSKNKITGTKTLKSGRKGRKVALLQALLNHYKGQKLKIDGVFGEKTRYALMRNGFPLCASARTCEVTTIEFLDLLKKSKNDKSFKKQYNINTNSDMKAVWDKYSS